MYEKPDAPASIGGVLDQGFKLLRASFVSVIGLSILANIIGQIPSLAMMSTVDADGVPDMGAGVLIAVLISMLISLIFYGAIIGRIHAIHSGRETGMGDAFSLGFSCMLPMLGFFILYGLAVLVGSILLLIPGLILAVSLMFGSYILIIDRQGVIESLKQSHKLVWGYWWRTTAILTVAGIIAMVAYTILIFIMGFMVVMNPENAAGGLSITETLLSAVLIGLITPVFYAITMAAFYDLRLRRDGEDLASRIEAEPATA